MAPLVPGHSGAPRSGEPGIHIPEAGVHGFRVLGFAEPRNDRLVEFAIRWSRAVLPAFRAVPASPCRARSRADRASGGADIPSTAAGYSATRGSASWRDPRP